MNPTRLLTSTFTNVLPPYDKLKKHSCDGLKANRDTPQRVCRGVALIIVSLLMGISLSAEADGGSIKDIDPKSYISSTLNAKDAKCLKALIGKESAWNRKAVGNLDSPSKSYTYGLLQLKNPIVKDESSVVQIQYGLKYIYHRYGKYDGICKAWSHWQRKGWH